MEINLTDKEKEYFKLFVDEYNQRLKADEEFFNQNKYYRCGVCSWWLRHNLLEQNCVVKTSTINYYLNKLVEKEILVKETQKATYTKYFPSDNYKLALMNI